MTEPQTIAYNREACERVLARANRKAAAGPVALNRGDLCNAPYDVLEALVWAYRRIEELEVFEFGSSMITEAKCD